MGNLEIKMTIDPTDKYEKANKDTLQALDSINDLNVQQQQQLFRELVSIYQFRMLMNNCQKFGR